MTVLDTSQARADLETMTGEAWARVYGARLLEATDESRQAHLRVAKKLVASVKVMRGAFDALVQIETHLKAFEVATGWSRLARNANIPASKARWSAARKFAARVTGAMAGYFERSAEDLRSARQETTEGLFGPALDRLAQLRDSIPADFANCSKEEMDKTLRAFKAGLELVAAKPADGGKAN